VGISAANEDLENPAGWWLQLLRAAWDEPSDDTVAPDQLGRS